jgi:hypothetical protein
MDERHGTRSGGGGTATVVDPAAFKTFTLDELVEVRDQQLATWIGGLPTSLEERITAYVDALIAQAQGDTS